MRAKIVRRRSCVALAAIAMLALLGCHRQERIPETQGAIVRGELRFVGRVVLEGSLSGVREGGICVRLVEQDTGRVVLQRIYDLGDPAWDRRTGRQALYFSLTPADAFDAEAPVHAPIVLEAFHLRPGVRPDAAEVGVAVGVAGLPAERVRENAVPGERDVELVLSSAASVAGRAPADEPARPR